MRGTVTTILVLSLLTFLVNGLVHAVIPHNHDAGQESKWSQLHGALRHEEKAVAVFFVSLAIAVVPVIPLLLFQTLLVEHAREMQLLRRGIHRYRRFR
jgi:hypothetical protein